MFSPVTLPVNSWNRTEKGRYFATLELPKEGISLDDVERELIEIALKQAGGNRTQAARLLGISRDTLRYRIKKFDLVEDFRRERTNASGAVTYSADAIGLSR